MLPIVAPNKEAEQSWCRTTLENMNKVFNFEQ